MSNKTIRVGKQTADDAEKTKNDILNGAYELFSTKGFDSTSVREIGISADVSHGTIRHHFGSKLDIWFAIVDRHNAAYVRDLSAALEQAATGEQDNLGLFKSAVEVLINTLFKHPKMLRLISMEYDIDNERSQYLSNNLIHIHRHISKLFRVAREESPQLKIYNEDTFLIALLGLISSPIIFPVMSNLLTDTDINCPNFKTHYQSLIINALFG